MPKSGNKTQPTEESVDGFLAKLVDEGRRADAIALREIMERLSGERAVMWGASIIGCGAYRYSYDSGREGRMARIGFSPRATELVLYVVPGFSRYEDLLLRLGRHRTGKSCLYIKRLSDVDRGVLEELVSESLRYTHERYPELDRLK